MNTGKKYQGVIVPMVTPLDENLGIDRHAVEILTDNIISHHSIPFILGTTGEASSMSEELSLDLVKSTIRAASGKSPVIAGVSSNSLQTSLKMAGKFADAGLDAVVSTLPAYYPMEDGQISAYIEKLADLLPLPLILYNMPGTIGYSIPLDMMEGMSYHPNIIGIKDSERDTDRLDRSLELWSERQDFSFWLGWAAMSLHAIKNGADGIVPSTGNLVPELYHELYLSVLKGDMDKAALLQERTNEISLLYQKDRKLNRSLPALKALLSVGGLCQPYVLPPLLRMEPNEEQQYMEKMKVELNRLTG